MATITVRNIPARIIRSLKSIARKGNRSMEQEVRDLLEEHVAARDAVLEQIEAGWERQARRPAAREVDAWIDAGRA